MSTREPKTFKERMFVKEYISNGGNGTQAALASYDCSQSAKPERTAAAIASFVLTKINISEALDASGISDNLVLANLKRIMLSASRRDPTTGLMVSDDRTQLEAIKFVAKLKGWDDRASTERQDLNQLLSQQKEKYEFTD